MFIVSQLPPEEKYAIISLITIGFAFHEVTFVGGFSLCMIDLAPDFVGILQGINNTIGLMPGFVVPSVVAAMTANVYMLNLFKYLFSYA